MKTPRTDYIDRKLHKKGLLTERYSEMLKHSRKLEEELNEWKDAAKNGSGCTTPEGLRNFIFAIG